MPDSQPAMPDSGVRPWQSMGAGGVAEGPVTPAAARDGSWPVKPGGGTEQQQQQRPPQGAALACGVGMLDGVDGARSRCAREEGTSAQCECGRHTFVLSAPAPAGSRPQQQQQQAMGCENSPPQARSHTEDIENISRSMVQAMARGDKGAAASTSSGSSSSAPHHAQQSSQQQQQLQEPRQQHGKRLSLPGSGSGAELPLDRIVVEPNGDMVLVEPSVVCDACPACDDVCALAACRGCAAKRARLLARGDMCLLDVHGRRLIRESSSAGGGSGPAGCVPRIGKPRTPSSGAAASGAGASSAASACYTLCEIRRHRTLGSCWLVAKGQVYDATRYLSSHPAGAIAIARKAGGAMDCSEDLDFHSGRAQKLWRHLKIGTVAPCPSEALTPGGHGEEGPEGRASSSGSSSSSSSSSGRGARAYRHRHHWRENSGAGSLVGSSCSLM